MPAAPVHICRRQGSSAGHGGKIEMRSGIYGVARPDFLPVFKEDKLLAVTDAVSAGKPLIVAVAIVQLEGRMRHGGAAR